MATTVGLKLETKTRDRLKQLGEQKDRSTHWLMKRAISEYLEKEECFEREKEEDLQRWQNYQETGEAVSQTEMASFFEGLIGEAAEAQNK